MSRHYSEHYPQSIATKEWLYCTYMHACMHVHMDIALHSCLHSCTHLGTHVTHMHAGTHTHTHAHTPTHLHTPTYTPTHTHTHPDTQTHMQTYTNTHNIYTITGITCEHVAVNKMADGKLPLTFLYISPSRIGQMQKRIVRTLTIHQNYVFIYFLFLTTS